MPSDNPVAKRNALVIPAGLVLFYCVMAILYAELIRTDATLCKDGGKILVRDVCYNVWKLMLPLLLIASGLLLGGLLGFRTRRTGPTADLYHGSGAHFVMALLASFVAVPLLGLVIQYLRERTLGTTFVVTAYDIDFEHTFLLGLGTLVGALMLLPFLALYLHQDRRRRRFLDVADLPRAEAVRQQPEPSDEEEQGMWAPLEEEWNEQDPWEEVGREPWPGAHAALPRPPPVPAAARPSPDRRPQLPGEVPVAQPPLTEKDDAAFEEGVFLAGVVEPADAEPVPPAPEPEPAPAEPPAAPEPEPEPEPAPAPEPAPPRADEHLDRAVDRLHEVRSHVPAAVDRLAEKPEEAKPAPYYDYPDVSRPVAELPGVDRAAAKLLDSAGIRTTARLRYESDDTVSRAAGVPRDRVQTWKRQAELLCVPGIGPAYAQSLVAAGVTGVDDLKRLAAETIHKRVGAANPAFTVKRIQAWQENARGLRRVRQPVPDE